MVADQEEDIEGLEAQGLDHEQVSCPDGLSVVGKEGTPALAGRSGWPAPPVAADGACADDDAELEQLTADALGAPVWVLAPDGGDQRPDLGLQARPSQRAAGTPAPEKAPALAMPAQHGLGPDQEEVASPVPVEAVDDEPEQLVPGAEAGPTLATESDLELLAEEQVLEQEALAAAQGVDERG
jgi:hypothetical protein